MFFLYLITLVPVFIGAGLFVFSRKVNWVEWVGSSAIGFVFAAIFHALVISGMTDDVQTLSGEIIQAEQYSRWQEYYEYAVYRTEYYTDSEGYTDSKGRYRTRTVTKSRQVFSHWASTTCWHEASWESHSNIDTSYRISEKDFNYLCKAFDNKQTKRGTRSTGNRNSRMIAGDPNDYFTVKKTDYIHPVTKVVSWTNRVKAAPSVFSFVKVDSKAPVFEYPKNNNHFVSDRLLGTANNYIDISELDKLNATVGKSKGANVIIVGFGKGDSSLAHLQEAKWIGGKKNDIVICYGGEDNSADWCYVFGWTEQEICKKNLQTLFLERPINNEILIFIQQEIMENYKIKDWTKFDYLTIEPPSWVYWVFLFLMVIIQTGFWIFAFNNEFSREDKIYG